MKFTSEDLMKAMGLSIGDRIKVKGELYKLTNFEIIEDNGLIYLKSLDNDITFSISCLVNEDYEIIPIPKRVGELKCIEIDCNICPLKCLCMGDVGGTLYDSWEQYKKPENMAIFDQEIHDLLKARLDKEVE